MTLNPLSLVMEAVSKAYIFYHKGHKENSQSLQYLDNQLIFFVSFVVKGLLGQPLPLFSVALSCRGEAEVSHFRMN